MNIELIRKFRVEFDAFLDGNGIFVKLVNQDMVHIDDVGESIWELATDKVDFIILDDKLFKIREHLALGDKVKVKFSQVKNWVDFKAPADFDITVIHNIIDFKKV